MAANCTDADSDQRFFDGVFSTPDPSGSAGIQGYSAYLMEAREEPLACGASAEETYRLTFVSENDGTIIIRAQTAGDASTVVVRESNDRNPPRIVNRNLSSRDWQALVTGIDHYQFWNRPAYPSRSQTDSATLLHGPVWLLEGRKGDSYHAVSRVANYREREFEEPARELFRIAGLEMPDVFKRRP